MPVTIYLDLKHGCGHGDDNLFAEKLDEILCLQLGREYMFTPRDLLNYYILKCSTTNNLDSEEIVCDKSTPFAMESRSQLEIIREAGWPSIGELLGKFIIILTGEDLDFRIATRRRIYCERSPATAAFVDLDQRGAISNPHEELKKKRYSDTDIQHPYYQQGNRIFLNIEKGRGHWEDLAKEASLNGFMTRIWKCNTEEDFQKAKDVRINFIATDHVLTNDAKFTSFV